jgi:hypothetical protein
MRSVLTFLLVAGLVACANQGGASIESTASAEETATASEAPTASDEPTPSEEPTASDEPTLAPSLVAEATITGVLSADDIEGGCVFLEAEDGMSYEVIWPDGWSVSPQLDVINSDGEVVASGGDRITVHGRIATDMASICQIGQIFEATDVTVAE